MEFKEIYEAQINFQKIIKDRYDFEVDELQSDNVNGFMYHMLHMISELGEVLAADKRWKSYRKEKYDNIEKIEELADCFIVLMNICIFSGYNSDDIENNILKKIYTNINRVKEISK